METTRTYYDSLKAKVYWDGHAKQWKWQILSSDGQLMAAGEEFNSLYAHNVAREAIGVLRIWSSFSRGSVTPATDGRRWFTFENTESNRDYGFLPTRSQLNALTQVIKEGKNARSN